MFFFLNIITKGNISKLSSITMGPAGAAAEIVVIFGKQRNALKLISAPINSTQPNEPPSSYLNFCQVYS